MTNPMEPPPPPDAQIDHAALNQAITARIEEQTKEYGVKKYPVLQYFEYAHLPPHLQGASRQFAQLAWDMSQRPTQNPAEIAAGLRKLLEAKDCIIRGLL